MPRSAKVSSLKLTPGHIAPGGKVNVSLTVENTGARAGDEVVQLYVHQATPSVKRPAKELRGFQRIALQPKEKKTVSFTLPTADLAFYDVTVKKFVVKPGTFDIMLGASSDDIRLKDTVQVK